MTDSIITTPDSPLLDVLCHELESRAAALDSRMTWPSEQLRWCAARGVNRWFVPLEFGGLGWSELDTIRGYLRLSAACLTTTFILTQFTSACRRIVDTENGAIRDRLLASLLDGSQFTTVGISHLTTSRRHLATPVMQAAETTDGFTLSGYSPWVTGANQADSVVLGATTTDGRQILVALPTNLPGVSAPAPVELVALTASCTGELRCESVLVGREYLLAGPAENVMAGRMGGKTGGLQTSALAIGLASAAIKFIAQEAARRPDLVAPLAEFQEDRQRIEIDLLALANGDSPCSNESLRARANSIALRATQAALVAAKGTGYVVGHPAGRWCREALFFLVWSCPQPVSTANLCELAGLESLNG